MMFFRGSTFLTGLGGGASEEAAEGAGGGNGPGGACAQAIPEASKANPPTTMKLLIVRIFSLPSCSLLPDYPIPSFPAHRPKSSLLCVIPP
jgi:hypothetical protein